MEAICPDVNTDGRINIISGRHPLIKSDEVVPIDLSLGDKFTILSGSRGTYGMGR